MGRFTRRRAMLVAGSAALTPTLASAGLKSTPAQQEGPFYPVHETDELDADLTRVDGQSGQAEGEVILVKGRVTGLDNKPVEGALVDVWQANHHGRYIHPKETNEAPLDPNFQAWAMVKTNAQGEYTFKTIRPGAYSAGIFGQRCSHIHFKISHKTSADLTTQMYFEGDPQIEGDIVMEETPEEERHHLIASASEDAKSGLTLYTFDIVLDTA